MKKTAKFLQKSLLVLLTTSSIAFAANANIKALPTAPGTTESPAIKVGNMVFISGQGGGSTLTPSDPSAAIEESLQAIQTIATQMGGDMSDIVKVDVYLADIGHDYPLLNEIFPKYFKEPYPTRTTVGAFIPKNHTVEIDAVMVLKN